MGPSNDDRVPTDEGGATAAGMGVPAPAGAARSRIPTLLAGGLYAAFLVSWWRAGDAASGSSMSSMSLVAAFLFLVAAFLARVATHWISWTTYAAALGGLASAVLAASHRVVPWLPRPLAAGAETTYSVAFFVVFCVAYLGLQLPVPWRRRRRAGEG